MKLIGGINHGVKRRIKELTVDKVDFVYRILSGQSYLPPRTLREFVGGAKGFNEVGRWFVDEFDRLGLAGPGCAIFDVGCGCGRLAYAFATSPKLAGRGITYVGMDIDRKSVDWCRRNIASKHPGFSFYHVDMRSVTYNPNGKHETGTYRFPHAESSFDLVILTSVFTHLLEDEVRQYFRELARVLKPGGTVYASFFTYREKREALEALPRRKTVFPHFHGNYALESEEFPENAVAFQEEYLKSMVADAGLTLKAAPMYGLQDVLLLGRADRA
ncbi:MAG TPA: class I SAM-dependent methyltransferase [Fibrobacteria bacterium]|nr:class I SAM-dependent methyltransferase [Fibrobacteria bacterium]